MKPWLALVLGLINTGAGGRGVAQKERNESMFTLASRVSGNVREALVRSVMEDLRGDGGRSLVLTTQQWRAAATLLPMPLLLQLLIYAWLHHVAPPPLFYATRRVRTHTSAPQGEEGDAVWVVSDDPHAFLTTLVIGFAGGGERESGRQ
jgi:hypothetical protein